jgi:hypothetical protein
MQQKDYWYMTKSTKTPIPAKANDRRGRGGRLAVKTDQPAQEIADDEVEIAKTGAKPGEARKPMRGNKP